MKAADRMRKTPHPRSRVRAYKLAAPQELVVELLRAFAQRTVVEDRGNLSLVTYETAHH
jgi:hypothetical protein